MSKLWPIWKNSKEPDAGVYELVMLAGFDDRDTRRVLYICKSLRGHLNEAFEWPNPGNGWVMATVEEAKADGWEQKEYEE